MGMVGFSSPASAIRHFDIDIQQTRSPNAGCERVVFWPTNRRKEHSMGQSLSYSNKTRAHGTFPSCAVSQMGERSAYAYCIAQPMGLTSPSVHGHLLAAVTVVGGIGERSTEGVLTMVQHRVSTSFRIRQVNPMCKY